MLVVDVVAKIAENLGLEGQSPRGAVQMLILMF
jgi:hypothetical protein